MQILTCILIDDEQAAIDTLEFHFEKIDYIKVIRTFNNPLDALSFLEKTEVDLIFLDIIMPVITGLEFLNLIKNKTDVILTSASRQYALEGFENEVLDYLLKPFSMERILQVLQRARLKKAKPIDNLPNDYIVLKTDSKHKLVKVDIADIIYIEGLKNYISVYTSQQRIITLLNIKSIEESLPKNKFIRIHKSYIVSLNKVWSVDGNQIYFKEINLPIPISNTYKAAFFDLMRKKLIENR